MSSTSTRPARFFSRSTDSAVALGRSSPASPASASTASGNDSPSVAMTKSKMLPLRPEEKSNHAILASFT